MSPSRRHRGPWSAIQSFARYALHPMLDPESRSSLLTAVSVAPAVLVLLTVVVLGITFLGPQNRVAVWYQQQGLTALADHDYATARLCFASLLQKKPDNSEYQFGLAQSLAGLGDQTGAALLLHRLAPEDKTGYLPAHVYLAQQTLLDPKPTSDALKAAEQHLLRVLRATPGDKQAHGLIAVLYSQTNRWELVQQHLMSAGPAADELALTVAQAFAKRGDQREVEIWSRRAAAYYATRIKSDPKNDELRLKYAQSILFQRDFGQTIDILDAGWRQTQKPVFRKAVAHVAAIWLKEVPTMEIPRRFALLETALQWDSQNPSLLKILLDPATASDASTLAPATRPVAGAAIRSLALAVSDARKNQPDKLRSELNTALHFGGPAMPTIIACLAGTWSENNDTDASAALSLSTALLEAYPKEPAAQWAQGKVLTQQGKYNQAASYLETALTSMPDDAAIHTLLATCYEKLSQPTRAAEHRQLAQAATAPSTQPASK